MLQDINRKIMISSEINEEVANEVIQRIMAINEFDEQMSSWDKYEIEPIEITINSGGGNVTDGFAIIGAMEMSQTPIVTYGLGLVASMALAIFVAGHKRVAHRFCRFMYHSISYGMMGHIKDHEDMRDEANTLQEMYNSIMFHKTKFTEEQLTNIREMKKDFYFSGKNAVKFGVADEVILRPEPIEPLTEEEIGALIKQELERMNLVKK